MSLRTWLGLSLIPGAFFVSGLLTLGDYGVNVDEPFHFMRGQAYLHYYLTGSKTYDNLEGFAEYIAGNAGKTASNEDIAAQTDASSVAANDEEKRFSAYQQPTHTAESLIAGDVGHPPVNGILAAASNKLFYQQLGWLGDIESYHLAEIAIATLGIALVMAWAYLEFGLVAAVVSGIALALHPMYLGESRFNIKDPIETVFFAATLFCAWYAIRLGRAKRKEDESFKWLLGAGVGFGLAFATKFNALFVLPILGAWALLHVLTGPWSTPKTEPHPFLQTIRQWINPGILWGIPIAVVVAAAVTYVSWPNLWGNPLEHLELVWAFYTQLGTSEQYATQFLTASGWNLYPLLDVLFRAPLITLLLSALGLVGFVRYYRTPQFATLLLWVIWLVIPILRVTMPEKALYGATRQIMEYLPALALFAGVGATIFVESMTKLARNAKVQIHAASLSTYLPTLLTTAIVLLYVPVVVTLVRYHPNPQLFYNSLIGGLSGAHKLEFPFWDNTMNNAYVAGIDWLNANAEPNANLSLVIALRSSLPPHRLRDDIDLSNRHFSGPLEEGEYIMEILPLKPATFIPKYIDRFLEPVYTYSVDGVPLLAIWKNDGKHTREVASISPTPIDTATISTDGRSLALDFGSVYRFHRLELVPADPSTGCVALTEGALSISTDGTTWNRIENVPYVGVNRPEFQQHPFPDYLFAGDRFRYISISPNENACLLTPTMVRGWIYDN